MKWSPYVIQTADGVKRGEQWRLLRTDFDEHLATVTKGDYLPIIGNRVYQAEVIVPTGMMFKFDTGTRKAAELFPSMREAQLWCEREVRLMEVGELA